MTFIDAIFSLVWDIRGFFYDAYLETKGWIWPFSLVSPIFFHLAFATTGLLSPIAHFGDWCDDIADSIEDVLGWDTIKSYIITWLPFLEATVTWWKDWLYNVNIAIETWIEPFSETIKGWIKIATEGIEEIISGISDILADLKDTWDDFWTEVWPEWTKTLNAMISNWVDFVDSTLPFLAPTKAVVDLIDSTLKTWFPFYDALAQLWSSIADFFTNPLDWLVDKLEDWFWGVEAT